MAVEVIRLVPSRLLVGIACVVIAAIPLAITPFVTPRFISLLCNDLDASYPYRPTTLPAWLVFVVGYATAFLMFLSMGLVAQYHPSYILPGRRPRVYHIFHKTVPRAVVELLRGYATFVFGTFLTISITEIVKIMVGRPRPDFWAVCKPVFIIDGVRVDRCQPNSFVDVYECQNPVQSEVRDSRLSFLSGHTAFSFYCATYLACYIERKFRPVQLPCLRLLLQVILFFLALLTGLSRIVDNQHHWSDVLAGAILGIIIGYYTEQLIKADLFGRGVIVKSEADDESNEAYDQQQHSPTTMNMAYVDDRDMGQPVGAGMMRPSSNGHGVRRVDAGPTHQQNPPRRSQQTTTVENAGGDDSYYQRQSNHHGHNNSARRTTGTSYVYPNVISVDETRRQ